MQKPYLSMIIPVYNVRNYIVQCLTSVKAQGFIGDECEVIVVDDGSTDGSADLISEDIQSGYVRYIRKENGGLSSARNAGMAVASGEYVYFLDSDDVLMPGCLKKGLDKAIESGADMVWFGAVKVYDDSKEGLGYDELVAKARENASERSGEYGPVIDSRQFVAKRKPHNYVWQYLVRRQALEGMSFQEGHLIEDCMFTYELLLKGISVIEMDADLYCYRIRPQSITTTRNTAKRTTLAKDYIYVSQYLRALLDRYEVPQEAREFVQAKAQGYLVREGLMQLLKYPEGRPVLEEKIQELKSAGMYPLSRPAREHYPHVKYDIYKTILNSTTLRRLSGMIFKSL